MVRLPRGYLITVPGGTGLRLFSTPRSDGLSSRCRLSLAQRTLRWRIRRRCWAARRTDGSKDCAYVVHGASILDTLSVIAILLGGTLSGPFRGRCFRT